MPVANSAPVTGDHVVTFDKGTSVFELVRLEKLNQLGLISMSEMTKGAISLILTNRSWRDETPESRTFQFSLHGGAELEMVRKELLKDGVKAEVLLLRKDDPKPDDAE